MLRNSKDELKQVVGTAGVHSRVEKLFHDLIDSMPIASEMAVGAGAGITGGTGTVYETSVVKSGGIITTVIMIDLTGLSSSTTLIDIIGVGTSPAHIGQVTADNSGTIFSAVIRCIETPAGGVTDIDLYSATEATGVFDGGVAALTETVLHANAGAWSAGDEKVFSAAFPSANQYLYLANGAAGTAAAYTAGRFRIELEGYVA